jgi:AraC-like DNA-binding protein
MSDLFKILFFAGSIQSILLALGLGLRKENTSANKFLIVILSLFGFNLFKLFIDESGLYKDFPYLLYSDISIALLYGPLFYFYVRSLTGGKKWCAGDVVHLIPFFVHLLLYLPVYFLDSEAKIKAYENYLSSGFGRSYQPLITYGMKAVQYFAYLVMCITVLRKYKDKIKDHLSSTYKTDLSWLLKIFYVNAGFIIFLLVSLILHSLGFFTMTHGFSRVSYLWDMVIILILSIMALKQSPVFHPSEIRIDQNVKEDPEEHKYGASRLEKETIDSVMKELLEFMETEKPYLDPDLTVTTLGEKISIQRHILSQVINSGLNENFYSFINKYRVEEVKVLLSKKNNKNKTILEIAFLAGFNSKSHFNGCFRKTTGMTPKEYRKKVQI